MMLPVESFYRRREGPDGGTLHGMRIIPIPNLSAGGSLCPWYTKAHFDSDNLSTSSRNTTHKTHDAAPAAAKPLKFGMDRILASSPHSSPQPSPHPSSPVPPSTSSEEPERLSDSPPSPVHHNSSAAQSVSTLPPSKRYAGEVACPRPTHGAPQLLFPHALLGSYAAGSLFPSCFAPAGTDPSSLPLHPNPAAVMRQGWPYLTPHYHGYPLFSSGGHGRRSPGADSGPSGKRKRSWSRAVFSALQRKGLEKRFDVQKYVTKPDRRQLAAMLGLTDAQVKVWFQNRRMKWRHQMEAAKKATEERKSTEADDTRAGAKRDTPRAVGNAASQANSDTKTDSVVPHS